MRESNNTMNLIRKFAIVACAAATTAIPVAAQDVATRVTELRAIPESPSVAMGATAPLRIAAFDAAGNEVTGVELRVSGRGVSWENGQITGQAGGTQMLIASLILPADFTGDAVTLVVPVEVTWPAIARVDVSAHSNSSLYAGTMIRHGAAAFHRDGSARPNTDFSWSSSNPSVATVNAFGTVMAHAPGSATISADFEGSRGSISYNVAAMPAATLAITGGSDQALQGDVVRFNAAARTASGQSVNDIEILWSTYYVPDDTIKAPGAAGIVEGGAFVGEAPGQYTILASAGDLVARRIIDVRPRDVVREVEVMGQGSVDDVHTSDLWVYEGLDGRDYAVTGTWGGNGIAKFWDVTDPANQRLVKEIQVDARTVNDVKVSPDGRYAALSREGTSTRRDGPVLIDLADPTNPVIAGYIDDARITGGVHNMFAQDDYLFALAGGDKYIIFDVTDLANPTYVSEYNHPDSRIHDVWVSDGMAYSSEWGNGVVVVDVGNGRWGGSIENPVFVTNFPYPVGATHAAYPYRQESTGKVYLFLGDEIMARGGAAWSGAGLGRIPTQGGTPSVTSGYIHIIDFTDPENPVDVARYEVPEFGTHNLWVEDDVLYVAYYEGGVRVVDVSGELMGNLATQGREMAVWKAYDPNGYVANAPMAWGPQPHKGNLFFTDFNSGLWSIKLAPKTRPIT